MKKLPLLIVLSFMLTACAGQCDRQRVSALYDKYDAHCREHARHFTAEIDEEVKYKECMDYFITTDVDCPYCNVDTHMIKEGN